MPGVFVLITPGCILEQELHVINARGVIVKEVIRNSLSVGLVLLPVVRINSGILGKNWI